MKVLPSRTGEVTKVGYSGTGGARAAQTAAETPITDAGTYYTGTDVEAALQELGAAVGGAGTVAAAEDGSTVVAAADTFDFRHGLDVTDPGGGPARVAVDESELSHNSLANLTTGDPHTQYRLEADNHTHASSGAQGGTIDHGVLTGLSDDDHPQYVLKAEAIQSHPAAGTTETVDWTNGQNPDVELSATCTITLQGGTAGKRCSMLLGLIQTGAGGFEATLAASGGVTWANGATAPSFVAVTGTKWAVPVYTDDGGSNWVAFSPVEGSIVAALDDLTDVTIGTPAAGDRLRYDGSGWVNTTLHWTPMVDYDGLVMLDSGGNNMEHEVI